MTNPTLSSQKEEETTATPLSKGVVLGPDGKPYVPLPLPCLSIYKYLTTLDVKHVQIGGPGLQ